jgi:protein SCO1/2
MAGLGRRGVALGIAGGAVGLGLIATAAMVGLGRVTPEADAIGGPFTLRADDGRAVTDRSFRGKFLLVYFGYTFCPDVCPTTLAAVADALDALGGQAQRLQVVFITVDPKRDTEAVLKAYTANFSPQILGLTGTEAEIAAAAKAYKVYYAPRAAAAGGAYTVDHSSILYLMGPDGRFITPIAADSNGKQLAAKLRAAMG